jgi:nitronate monooxygenase
MQRCPKARRTMWMTRVTRRLGLRVPIVQGPFGGGLSSLKLAAAVSNGGGLGSFGAHMLRPDEIAPLAAAIRAETDKPFALNLWVSTQDPAVEALTEASYAQHRARLGAYFEALGVEPPAMPERFAQRFEDQVEALLEARPPAFSFVFGVPSASVLDACRSRGITTIGAATTVPEARALDTAGVDLIVATGFEAGGHRPSFLRSAEASLTGTLALVPQVVDAVRAPVIAAGGIADGRGVAAVLALGAGAAQVGTAFLACEESAAPTAHREALFSDAATRTALTRGFSGRLARGIHNRFVDEVAQREVAPYPVQSWLTGSFRAAALAQNRSDLMALWSGQSAGLLRHRSAATLLASLVDEARAALRGALADEG